MSIVPTVPSPRIVRTQSPVVFATAYERSIQVLALVLIVSSTFMRAEIPIGVGDLYPPQVIALALFPLAFWRTQTVTGVLTAIGIGIGISILATLGSLSLPDPAARYRVLVQIMINSFTMLVTISLLSHLSRAALRQLVSFLCWLLFIAALAQAFLAPGWNARGTSTFGIPRPVLFFHEEGYTGLFAAFLFCAALALRARSAAILAAAIVVIADNRGAYIVAIAAALLAIPWIQSRRVLRGIVFIIPLLLGALFLVSTLLNWSLPILNEDTGQTRQSDTQAILGYNNYSLFPWGGEVLNVFDESRDRQIKDTMNIWLIDLIWKFGFGGIVVFATWIWAFLSGIPKRIAPVKFGDAYWIPLGSLFGLVGNLNLNNPVGYSWMWVMIGLLFAVMATSVGAHLTETTKVRLRNGARA